MLEIIENFLEENKESLHGGDERRIGVEMLIEFIKEKL